MARQRLSEDTLRRHVFHPDQDLYLTGILGLIAPAVAAWRAVELPGSLNAKDRIDVSVDPSLFSRMTKYVKDVLNVSQPRRVPAPQRHGRSDLDEHQAQQPAAPDHRGVPEPACGARPSRTWRLRWAGT